MTEAITAIVIGLASIVAIIAMAFFDRTKPRPALERKLYRRWLWMCCLALFLLLVVPGVMEILHVIPLQSFGIGGSFLFFFFVALSFRWYSRSVERLRAGRQPGLLKH